MYVQSHRRFAHVGLDLAYKTSLRKLRRTLSSRGKRQVAREQEARDFLDIICCNSILFWSQGPICILQIFCGNRRLSMLDSIMKLNCLVVKLVFALFYISGLVAQDRSISLEGVYPEAASRYYSTVELRCADIETLNGEQFPVALFH